MFELFAVSLVEKSITGLCANFGDRWKNRNKRLNAPSGNPFQSHVIFSKSLMGKFSIWKAQQHRQEPSKIVQVPHSHWLLPKHLAVEQCEENYSSMLIHIRTCW